VQSILTNAMSALLEAIGENSIPYLGTTIQRLTLYCPLGPLG